MQRKKMEIRLSHHVHMHNACNSFSKYDFKNMMQLVSNVSISLCMQKHINVLYGIHKKVTKWNLI
jgi:hypothetical protein